jgi:alpha-beta hydrolase superfamily lysophospholipase
MTAIREQAVLLGPRKSLVGIIAVSPSPRPDAPMIVILNSGIIHRVGANRMYVPLARALAAAGFPVLRFDLSGIGDSENRVDALSPFDASMADIREALDSVESSRQVRRFVLVGLCSGADHAILYTGTDKRVVGVALLDPAVPRTRGYYQRFYLRRLVTLKTWMNLLSGRHSLWSRWRARPAASAAEVDEPIPPGPDLQSPEVKAVLERAYQAALDNDNQLLVLFTEGREEIHNYREQLLDAYPNLKWGSRLRLEYFYDCDHTFTTEACRQHLVATVVDWIGKSPFTNHPGAGTPDGPVSGPASEPSAAWPVVTEEV